MVGCVSDPGVEKESGIEGRNEGKSAAYDTESNPAISCTLSHSCSALSIYGNGICMKGKPGLMDQNWCWNSFALTSGNRSCPIVWFWMICLWHMNQDKTDFFYTSINYYCYHIFFSSPCFSDATCSFHDSVCVAKFNRKSVVPWWWCCYGHRRL